jgi:hypothetical protein
LTVIERPLIASGMHLNLTDAIHNHENKFL